MLAIHSIPLVLWLYLSSSTMAGLLPWDPPGSSDYEPKVRNNTASFHKNFNAGPAGKQANGALVSNSIDWANNNANTLGRANFVNTLLSFDVPFPDLKIFDVFILVDGNIGAVFYYFQAHQDGPFGDLPATGRPMQVLNTELFMFDADARLARLITVNDLSHVQAQLTGTVPAPVFGNFTLVSNQQTSPYFRTKIKNTAAQFNNNFNANKTAMNAGLARPDVKITTGDGVSHGTEALLALFAELEKSHPDLLAHDAYVVGDGHYVAVGFIWEGTFKGDFKLTNGTIVPPDGKAYRTWAARWFQFDDAGIVTAVWQVEDHDNMVKNVQS